MPDWGLMVTIGGQHVAVYHWGDWGGSDESTFNYPPCDTDELAEMIVLQEVWAMDVYDFLGEGVMVDLVSIHEYVCSRYLDNREWEDFLETYDAQRRPTHDWALEGF